MSNRISAPPVARSAGDLDLLADIVTSTHVDTQSARGWYAGDWALRFENTRDRGFHIVLAGEVFIRLDDGTTHRLRAGDIALVGVPHVLATDLEQPPDPFTPQLAASRGVDEHDGDTCLLCGAYVLEDPENHPVFGNLPPLLLVRAGERHPSVDAMIEVLDAEFRGTAPGSRAVAARLIDAMLVYILRHWLESDCPTARGWIRALRDPVLARALALIHREYARPWTLETLARACGSSRASLARNFVAEVGTSPMQFLAERRLAIAQALLGSSAASLDEIAARVGYASGFSLSKAYKRVYGEAPRHHVRAAL
jgi:AraC-like DNA-binding protein